MPIVWGSLASIVYYLAKRDKRGALVVGLCVLSHWFLDLFVHVADLPISPFGEYKIGFGLWNHMAIELIIETVLFLTGVFVYATLTRSKNKIGSWGFWALVVLLLVFTVANPCGPTPPDSIMILFGSSVVLMTQIICLSFWVDKNRELA